MRLHALEVENFRKFDRPHRVAGFGAGVNVLAGPNELGKSTLLLAIHAALFEKFDANTAVTRGFRTRGNDAAPRVALSFETDAADGTAGSWRIEKRFLSRPHAVLTGPDGRRHEGDAAETRLRDMLGFDRQARSVDLGLWDALLVAQGGSFEQPEFGERACRTIGECLRAEIGALTGTGRADAVLAASEAALAAIRDRNNRPRGRARAVLDRLAGLDAALATLRTRSERFAADADRLLALERTRAHLRGRRADPASDRELASLRAAREHAIERAARTDAALHACRLATVRREAAESAVARRGALDDAVADAERAAAASAAREAERATRRDERTAEAAAATAARDAAAAARTEAAGRHRRAREAAEHGEARALLAARTALLARARVAADAVRAAAARLDAHRATPAALETIRARARAHEAASAALLAGATTVEIALRADAPSVRRDGAPLARGPDGFARLVLDADAVLEIEGVGQIRIRPPASDRAEARRRASVAADGLARALDTVGCASVDAAEAALAARDADARALDAARASLAPLVPGDAARDLAPGLEALAAEVERLSARSSRPCRLPTGRARRAPAWRAPTGAGADVADADAGPADAEARARGLAACRLAETDAEAALADATARARMLEQRREAAAIAHAEARVEADHAARALAERRARRADEQAASTGEDLAAALAEAKGAEADAARRLEAFLAAAAGAPEAETLALSITRLEQGQRNEREEEAHLAEEAAELRARIDEAGGLGLAEEEASLARERAVLAAEDASIGREAASLELLVATLRETVLETRAVALRPLADGVGRHLARLLPDAVPHYDDDYGIRAVSRRGGGDESFADLSGGTREQVAVLARVALGEMLRAAGRPAMIVLDDALAFSDPDRIDRMFDVLTDAATRLQVLVLTCRDDLFRRLGGTRLRIEAVP